MTDFENVLSEVGGCGKFQVITYMLIGFATLSAGMQSLANVFLVGLPATSCEVISGLSVRDTRNFLASMGANSLCSVPDINFTSAYNDWTSQSTINQTVTSTKTCTKWIYDEEPFGRTTVKEWDLVCSNAWLRALSSSIYMLGFLVGAIGFGSLADKIGRKHAMVLSIATMVVSGTSASFAPNYWIHVFLRMLSGAASAGVLTCGFVLIMEIISVEWRTEFMLFYQGGFALGYALLPWVSYALKDYAWICLIISLYPIIYISYHWIMIESPRWLLQVGKYDDAEKALQKIAKWNNREFNTLDEGQMCTLKQKHTEGHRTYTILDLLRTPNMRKKSLNIFFNWFVNSIVYYGLSLGSADLVGSPHLNLCLSGLVEFPGYILVTVGVKKFGSRFPLAGLLGFGGICCLLCSLIPQEMPILVSIFSLMGKMAISGSFSLIYLYSAEVFPTVVRNTGVGAGSMSARVGGIVAPFVAELGRFVWKPLPSIIFGGLSVLAGLLTLLLPETKGQMLPDTLEEGENFGKKTKTERTQSLIEKQSFSLSPRKNSGLH